LRWHGLIRGWGQQQSRQENSTFMNNHLCIASDVQLGKNVKLSKFINLYGCEIGDNTKIGAFVEIQKNARVGKNCKISSHTFICEGVTIEDNVFVGHGVNFTNDVYPRATSASGGLQTEADWKVEPTFVRRGASIGSGATILSGLTIGENSLVGAGAVVTHDVLAGWIVAGNPARPLRPVSEDEAPRMLAARVVVGRDIGGNSDADTEANYVLRPRN
jgi:acetyltransferase-like isoleucine patch superfamily enzyme